MQPATSLRFNGLSNNNLTNTNKLLGLFRVAKKNQHEITSLGGVRGVNILCTCTHGGLLRSKQLPRRLDVNLSLVDTSKP